MCSYLILLKENGEWNDWLPADHMPDNSTNLYNGDGCCVWDSNGICVMPFGNANLVIDEPWIIIAYVGDNDKKRRLADMIKIYDYRIFFHGGGVNRDAGMNGITDSFTKNYGGYDFGKNFMYFSKGEEFPANKYITMLQDVFKAALRGGE